MIHPPIIDTKEELPSPARNILIFRKSCWKFATDAVWTLDQIDKTNPIKRYPQDDDPKASYLKYMMNMMINSRLLALVKHRRMLMTWTACVVAIHEAMFFEGRKVAIVSKKEEDSDMLVQQCKFIYENISKDVMPFKPTIKARFCHVEFPELQSVIIGVAQGPDQLRQHTCSRVFCDEMAFWPHARQTFTALKPTLDGGGKACLISTRFPGFFKQLIEDTLDD